MVLTLRENTDMREMVRADTKEPIHEYLVRTVNVGLAAKVLRDVLNKKEVPLQRERVALAIWNKLVPSLAAMHVEIQDSRPGSVHDLNAMLLASGLDALDTDTQVIESTVEKVEAVQENRGDRVPPEASE
jgi:hypothetical protein